MTVANFIKQVNTLNHSIGCIIFITLLIIVGQGHYVQDCGYCLQIESCACVFPTTQLHRSVDILESSSLEVCNYSVPSQHKGQSDFAAVEGQVSAG